MKSKKEVKEIKKEFEEKFVDQVMTPQGGREVWEWIESTISQTRQDVIEKVESKLYVSTGFLREDSNVSSDIQHLLQDIKLLEDLNKK